MTKGYKENIKRRLAQLPHLEKALLYLIEKGFESRQGIIPIFEKADIAQPLLDEDIISDYNQTHYKVNNSYLLAQVVYSYFKQKFKLPEINSYDSIKAFIEQLDAFAESHSNRLGVRAVTKNLFPYLCIIINQEYGYQFDHILKISSKEEYQSKRFKEIRPIQKSFENLNISSQRMIEFVVHCLKYGVPEGEWYECIKKKYESDPRGAEEILNEIKKGYTNDLRFLLAHILEIIGKLNFERAFKEAINLFNNFQFIGAALVSFRVLNYFDKDQIQKILDLIEKEKCGFTSEKAKVYAFLAQLDISSDEQRFLCMQRIKELAEHEDIILKHQALQHVLSMRWDEKWVFETLKENYITGHPNEEQFWHDINYGIDDFKDKGAIFSLLEHFIEKFPKVRFADRFEAILEEMPREIVSYWLTKWLNSDELLFNAKAGELCQYFSSQRLSLVLSKNLLDTYSFKDIEYVIYKIIGFVSNKDQLSNLIFSALQRSPKENKVGDLVKFFFLQYILLNYKSSASFLKEKKKKGTNVEQKIANNILIEFEKKEKAIRELPRLKELQGSTSRIREYMNRRNKSFNFEEKIKEGSFFMQFVKNINLRAGKGFFNRLDDNTYSEPSILGAHKMNVELPAGELIDPTGQAFLRMKCQIFKRRE